MSKDKSSWSCIECGSIQTKWTGKCSKCGEWNTIVEEKAIKPVFDKKSGIRSAPISLSSVEVEEVTRTESGISEFDRLLGGGLVDGAFILVGGEPGIGKSTFLLQVAAAYANKDKKILYVSGEESASQVLLRANRLNIQKNNIFLLAETDCLYIYDYIQTLKPDIVIIDSIQIIFKSDTNTMPGSIVQVRDIATDLMKIAKTNNISIFVIGHVTKSGDVAGPKLLEHLVDVVLYIEGENNNTHRIIRSVKNRFGSTDELAVFTMSSKGLLEERNLSELFISQRSKNKPGSAIVSAIEGSRPILLEVQALVTNTVYSNPARRSLGIDQNRLVILLAILEKHLNYKLFGKDIFVSVIGGLKIKEPAIDLGVALAIISSLQYKAIDPNMLFIGEIGLNGDIRSVSRIESRIKEAIRMGFSKIIVPNKNLSSIQTKYEQQLQLIGVEHITNAVSIL